jgi:hypothetical protein
MRDTAKTAIATIAANSTMSTARRFTAWTISCRSIAGRPGQSASKSNSTCSDVRTQGR